MTGSDGYIHGYSRAEQQRLVAQAATLAPRVFDGMELPQRGRLLEIGCGVGAELKLVARRHPGLRITGIDLDPRHLTAARDHLAPEIARGDIALAMGDAYRLPFAAASFDCVITIWMLEHVTDPRPILAEARRVLAPGGRLICTEVDNARFGFLPEQPAIAHWWQLFNRFQADRGGNPFVGADLARQAEGLGFAGVHPQTLYIIDSAREPARRLELLDYLRDLLLSGAEQLIAAGYADAGDRRRLERQFEAARGLPDLHFHYHGVRLVCRTD
jgi:ubiquinone/menaquinone biosynthesis C-methylase UbiE